mgnify:CR=1 FL=1
MKREPAEPQGFIKLTGVGIPRLQAGEDVNVIQLTIELLMGIDLFLLGLILCLVALPLEAACWWRWRLSRMDADAALTLARALSSFRDYVSVRWAALFCPHIDGMRRMA